jgi:hypothetical protein
MRSISTDATDATDDQDIAVPEQGGGVYRAGGGHGANDAERARRRVVQLGRGWGYAASSTSTSVCRCEVGDHCLRHPHHDLPRRGIAVCAEAASRLRHLTGLIQGWIEQEQRTAGWVADDWDSRWSSDFVRKMVRKSPSISADDGIASNHASRVA